MIAYGLKPAQQFIGIAALREMWTVADEGGFDGCWVFDHFAALGPDPAGDVFEAWTLLAAMAQATRRVRLGCIVTGNTYRHPGVLAKMAVTVDHLSGGRLDVGIGAGAGQEHAMLGIPYGPPGERLDRLTEACQVLKLLWTEPAATFKGEHYELDAALANPKPLQRPYPPIWMGGSGERRSLRIIAEHADVWINANPPGEDPAELQRLSQVLDRHCADLGRDPATLRRAVQVRMAADADEILRAVECLVRAGFTEVILMPRGANPAQAAEAAAGLLPRLRTLG
jgi:F420-dependent oxidoreductase-like protein